MICQTYIKSICIPFDLLYFKRNQPWYPEALLGITKRRCLSFGFNFVHSMLSTQPDTYWVTHLPTLGKLQRPPVDIYVESGHISVRIFVCETTLCATLCFKRANWHDIFITTPPGSYVFATPTIMNSNRNMSGSDWKCFPVYTYWLHKSKWTFPMKISEVGEWVTQLETMTGSISWKPLPGSWPLLIHCDLVESYGNPSLGQHWHWVFPDGAKPLFEPILKIHHNMYSVAFALERFTKGSWNVAVACVQSRGWFVELR